MVRLDDRQDQQAGGRAGRDEKRQGHGQARGRDHARSAGEAGHAPAEATGDDREPHQGDREEAGDLAHPVGAAEGLHEAAAGQIHRADRGDRHELQKLPGLRQAPGGHRGFGQRPEAVPQRDARDPHLLGGGGELG